MYFYWSKRFYIPFQFIYHMNLDLENITSLSVPLTSAIINEFFTDDNNLTPTEEHKDQILMFHDLASKYLWDFEHKAVRVEAKTKFYKTVTTFNSNGKSTSEIKKYLYNLEIPFSNWVFFAEQPHLGFMLTWKMVIKYCNGIFFDDYQQIWDKTLNWKLEYNHGQFTFAKDIIYKSNPEEEKRLLYISRMEKTSRQ